MTDFDQPSRPPQASPCRHRPVLAMVFPVLGGALSIGAQALSMAQAPVDAGGGAALVSGSRALAVGTNSSARF